MASHDGVFRECLRSVSHIFVHADLTSDTACAPTVGPISAQNPPLLAPACAEPQVTEPHTRAAESGYGITQTS